MFEFKGVMATYHLRSKLINDRCLHLPSQNAFNIDLLWNPHDDPSSPASYYPMPGFPRGKQPLRRDAPHNLPSPIYPRRPPADPTDIEDYISDVRSS